MNASPFRSLGNDETAAGLSPEDLAVVQKMQSAPILRNRHFATTARCVPATLYYCVVVFDASRRHFGAHALAAVIFSVAVAIGIVACVILLVRLGVSYAERIYG